MLKLLKLEWSKFSGSSIIRLLGVFFLLFFPLVMYIGMELPKLPSFLPDKLSFYQFPAIWDYLGYAGNWMVFFFLGVMVIYTITTEVEYKTMRQSIINGMTRKSYFTSKLLTVTTLSLFATFYYILVAFIFGFINTESVDMSNLFDSSLMIPRFFLMSLSYLSFAMMIGLLLKKSGVAVFVYLTYVLFIESAIRRILKWILNTELVQYFPMNVTDDLMPLPFYKYAQFLESMDGPKIVINAPTEAIIATLIYVVLWVGGIYYLFTRRDL